MLTAAAVAASLLPPASAQSVDPLAGSAGWEAVPGSTIVTDGSAEIGEAVVQREIRFVRTGIVTEGIASGGLVTTGKFNAGDKVFAVELAGHSVGWCKAGEERTKPDGKVRITRGSCLFSEVDPNGKRRFFQTFGKDGGSAFWSVVTTGKYGLKTPVAVSEQPVDFGRKFSLQIVVSEKKNGEMVIGEYFFDGKNRTALTSSKVKLSGDSADIPVWGGRIRIEFTGTSAKVTQLQPVTDGRPTNPAANGVRQDGTRAITFIFI